MVLYQHFVLEDSPIFKHFSLTDFNYPLHLHRAFEIIFIESGQAHVQIEKNFYNVNTHQFVIIFPNQIHGFDLLPDTTITIVLFSPEIIGSFTEQYQNLVPENPVIFYPRIPDFNSNTNIFAIKGLLYSLCSKVIEQSHFVPQESSETFNLVHQIINFVNENYSDKCTLQDVAKSIDYDYVYLSKLFKKVMSISFTKYLNQIRTSKVQQLLKNTDKSITEIAYSVGYTNLQSFYHNFNQITEMSPVSYRKSDSPNKYSKALQENYISGN